MTTMKAVLQRRGRLAQVAATVHRFLFCFLLLLSTDQLGDPVLCLFITATPPRNRNNALIRSAQHKCLRTCCPAQLLIMRFLIA